MREQKKCCSFPDCDVDLEEILVSYDDGETHKILYPNHVLLMVIRENFFPHHILQTHPSEWKKENSICDAYGKDGEILYTTKVGNNKDLPIVLCKQDSKRLVKRNLTKTGYFKLREKYGIFHEIHDDFYDEFGNALQ